MTNREAVIVGAVRTPVGKRGGALSQWHPVDLLGHTLRNLVDRAGIDPALVEDVITGCAVQVGPQSANLGRHAVLAAGFPDPVPAVSITRQCGSGQQAVDFAAQGVIAGSYDLAIACGVESMSQTPPSAGLVPGGPLGPQYGSRMTARYDGGMLAPGPASELLNKTFEMDRESLDAFSIRSHARALAATKEGKFRDQMVPITADPDDESGPAIVVDEGIRENMDPAKLASLKTIFAADGLTTAANASQISDGAAALLIADRDFAERHGLVPRARFRAMCVAAADPIIQFTAVLESTRKALKRSGLTVDEIDLFEVNEAFAGVPLMVQREFEIPDEKLNVNGGSIAIGHPLGSTGARMLTDLLCELERTGKRFGMQTICEASGTANTTIIERI
ncbi:thiolase family protein [Rhodococcus sp. ARC_M6]|uniref:thiolase family protein n=1 Tax=Rhodococcus sp. ARC_M6 TaxID=2928852 RepID=UPI001FB26972|nr:thiolase family protein [Rhodococcus sp. ARC_M6]MCJ0907269.1 thiolase family protein [Rhodococcus sp. ARC_M6]